jgi:signal transduction histidine kinase/DNA-binding NarL/FixJ family response regulator
MGSTTTVPPNDYVAFLGLMPDHPLWSAGALDYASVAAWMDNRAVPITPTTLALAALLMATALVGLMLTWLLQRRDRKTKALQAELAGQRFFSEETLNALPFPVVVHRLDGTCRSANAACGHHRLAFDALMATMNDRHIAQTLQAGADGYRHEITYTGDDGQTHAAVVLNKLLLGPGGEPDGFTSSLFDVTEFHAAEQAARSTELRLREIAQHIPLVIFTRSVDAQNVHRLVFAAGDMHALFGLGVADLVDADDVLRERALYDRVHPDDLPAFDDFMSADGGTQLRSLDFRAFGQEGLRWIHAMLAPQRMPDGDLRLLGCFIDTTELNLRNETLRIARDVAERASKAKADFLATMSHEIRTPMNGVIGMLELLGHTPINAEQRELLRAVEDSASVLLQILNDILDFSKLEAGDLRLDETTFEPRALIDSVMNVMAAPAQKKGLSVRTSVDAGVAGALRGDSVRLKQILLNLVNNATKFTERGSVSVRLMLLGDDGSHQRVRLCVVDTGIGIAKDRQASLFNPFTQAEAWTSRRYGGTGLGLAICRHLAQLMDGSIELSSEPGMGTTIMLELRLPIAQREATVPANLRGRHAIVRVSSEDSATALCESLKSMGVSVENAPPSQPLREGMAASLLFVDPLDQASATQVSAHRVAVTDEPLRGMGIETAHGGVLLSANPLRWQSLIRACMVSLELEAAPALLPETVADQALPPGSNLLATAQTDLPLHRGHVLVAEDHPISQQLIGRQLALLGLSCDVVDNGQDAYEALSGGDYDLLLTDCNMPTMSGYELASAWRRHEAATPDRRRLPIVAMTANALGGEAIKARDAGMDDVLSKPLQLLPLSRKLGQWLPEAIELPAQTHGYSGVTGADDAFRSQMLQMFTTASRDDLRELARCVAEGDSGAAALALHRLLGALQLFNEDGALMEDGRRLLLALNGENGSRALPELSGFALETEKFLMKLNAYSPAPAP